jgi:hypothetical protein
MATITIRAMISPHLLGHLLGQIAGLDRTVYGKAQHLVNAIEILLPLAGGSLRMAAFGSDQQRFWGGNPGEHGNSLIHQHCFWVQLPIPLLANTQANLAVPRVIHIT